MGEWHQVSTREPCPYCGKPDWCSRTDGGTVACRRVDNGRGRSRIDCAGVPYWLYPGPGPAEWSPDPPPLPNPPRAAAPVLHQVYSALLTELRLSAAHRDQLRGRGLSDAAIHANGYRTLPPRGRAALARDLMERFGVETCARVPGIYQKEQDGRTWWMVGGAAGLLVPIRDAARRIVALLVRADDPGEHGKYLYLTSAKHAGPGPGAPVHVPLYTEESRVIRITEGALKADVATALSGTWTVGLPGVSAWRPAMQVLAELDASGVLLALDADARTNPHVAAALARTWAALQDTYLPAWLELWDPDQGKGIDDLLRGGSQSEVLKGSAARLAITGILARAEQRPTLGALPLPLRLALLQAAPDPLNQRWAVAPGRDRKWIAIARPDGSVLYRMRLDGHGLPREIPIDRPPAHLGWRPGSVGDAGTEEAR